MNSPSKLLGAILQYTDKVGESWRDHHVQKHDHKSDHDTEDNEHAQLGNN